MTTVVVFLNQYVGQWSNIVCWLRLTYGDYSDNTWICHSDQMRLNDYLFLNKEIAVMFYLKFSPTTCLEPAKLVATGFGQLKNVI